MSRNKKYELAQHEKGLKKVTVWVPVEREPEFKMLASACCDHRNLTFNTLRDVQSGKFVSLERI
ncbi:hypothetical protein L3V77_15740 [Vibrio sp. DW001]|uniref:hypothetical protein n=1 Tax=Vibrio sp. DW001 TaxID=2912315 RepID=UPI0023B0892C|nr:hypothetical protein [Vibrio sp. DW001]WED26429.1 hypothetical protein L3V77_15740 [Vibrio sp. DW001]